MKYEKITNDIFKERSNLAHNNKYDYSLTNCTSKRCKVKIICTIHGEFEQVAYYHYYFKQGCPKCKSNRKPTNEEFNEKYSKIHNYKYDYSKSNYVNAYTKIEIICKDHGSFFMRPKDHKKSGCSLCSLGYLKNNDITEEQYIEKVKVVHEDKYDYTKTKYTNSRSKVIITCRVHGDFSQKAESHLRGRGCPNCKNSIGENKIQKYLESKNIKYEKQKQFDECKNILKLPFDFYLTDYNICVEYDGIQHFEAIEHFGGNENFELRKKLDQIKNEYCQNNNIHLIRISYKENASEKLNQELTNFLNKSTLS